MTKKYLNIACGETYINDAFWQNIDFTTRHSSVKKVNILSGLPFNDNVFEVAYSSHFIEHIPKKQLIFFLEEVNRVLKPGGVFRIVTPDLEFLNREYITQIDKGEYEKANFISSIVIDQCVRDVPGGQLKGDIENIFNSKNSEMIEYVKEIAGSETFDSVVLKDTTLINKVIKKMKEDPKFIFNIILFCRVWVVSKFLPRIFRQTNVSNTNIGEKHFWLYDMHSLSDYLTISSFTHISRLKFNSTNHKDYIFKKLDQNNSLPRKGTHQLFIEAIKK